MGLGPSHLSLFVFGTEPLGGPEKLLRRGSLARRRCDEGGEEVDEVLVLKDVVCLSIFFEEAGGELLEIELATVLGGGEAQPVIRVLFSGLGEGQSWLLALRGDCSHQMVKDEDTSLEEVNFITLDIVRSIMNLGRQECSRRRFGGVDY